MSDKTTPSHKLNDPAVIRAWCMYDWANSVYTLTIATVVFPIYFSGVTRNAALHDYVSFFGLQVKNTVLYSYSLSFAFLLIATINPLLSGIADYSNSKKTFMKLFAWMGATASSLLYFFNGGNIEWGILCFIVATIGYAGSLVFYNAFLPEIVTKDQMDKVSARGYAYGYVGSVLLLIINLAIIMFPKAFGITDDKLPAKLAFLTVGIWWFVFSVISFRKLPVIYKQAKVHTDILLRGYREVKTVYAEIGTQRPILLFLSAFFVYSMGFQTMMFLASLFAENELKIPTPGLIASMLTIQIIAIFGATGLAAVSKRYGNLNAILLSVTVCFFCCIAAYYIKSDVQFYALAVVVGLVMGGLQSISRSTYSKLIPPTKDYASYFSFYELTEKVAIVLGTASYGIILQVTGSMRNCALGLTVFFLLGLIMLFRFSKKERYNILDA
ncbi:MAG: MFS transporter [Chitinophagales bacterium]|nr:MFS transporter [Chitinophagales bacterium]